VIGQDTHCQLAPRRHEPEHQAERDEHPSVRERCHRLADRAPNRQERGRDSQQENKEAGRGDERSSRNARDFPARQSEEQKLKCHEEHRQRQNGQRDTPRRSREIAQEWRVADDSKSSMSRLWRRAVPSPVSPEEALFEAV
jgi:hypothetical protein